MNAVLKWFALYAILMVGYYAQNRLTVGDTLYFNTLFLKDFSEVARNTGLIFLGGFLFWYFLLRSKPHPNTFTQDDPRLAHISNTPEGRFVCAPELQNPNYYKPSKEALQKPSLILRPENFCLLHKLNFCANDCSGYF